METVALKELDYEQVVARMNVNGVPCGIRRVRDVLADHKKLCPPIRYGYRTIRFAVAGVDKMIANMKAAAVKAGLKGKR